MVEKGSFENLGDPSFEGLSFVDFSLEILRNLSSKENQMKKRKIKSLTKTEEANIVISGLEVSRGFSLLAQIAEGKTLKEILRILNYACGTKNEDLATCQKTIEKWIKIKNSRFHLDGLRMFIERRNIGSMDEDVVKKVNQIFLEKFPENEGRHVIKELDFFIDPVGIFTKNKMDSEMKEATCGRISEVVKKDLVPDWRARLTLSVASDESFFWKTLSEPVISKAYFYDSYDKQACNRIYTKTIKAKCKVRRKVFKDIEIIELFSSNDESLIVLIPLKQKLSCSFLKEITAKKIVQYINMLPKEKTTSEIILPVISISFPLGLRAVFEKPHFEKQMDAEINVNIPFLFLVVGKYQNNEKEKKTKKMKLIHFIGKFTGSENNF